MIKQIKEVWDYRMMIGNLVKKELRVRYRGSVLGFLWSFLNPLFQLLVYTFLFSVVMRQNIDNYAMFLFVALVPWLFCSASLTGGSTCVIQQAGLVQKIYFPRMVLPIVTVCSNFVNMLLSFIVVFVALLVTGVGITPVVWALPVVMVIEFFFVLGMVLIVSAASVYFRDLEHILGIVTMAWMYLTPVLYSLDLVPEAIQGAMHFNPMTGIILGFRDILYYQKVPDFSLMIVAIVAAAVLMVIGMLVFQKLQRKFAEEL
ncbi:MAG: ABC transporter permease [Christensenellaceae bacterium]|jgi:lipopolysaccharide transport system permease protein